MVPLFMLSISLWNRWVTTTWAKKHHCPRLEWRNSSVPKEAMNDWQWVDENHWVICPETRFESTGNNVFNWCSWLHQRRSHLSEETWINSNSTKILYWFLVTGRLWQLGLLSGWRTGAIKQSLQRRHLKNPSSWCCALYAVVFTIFWEFTDKM